ncbi:MAG: energy-coupling factor ABC transporter ATP-binding protein [Candidatus Rifleibacteriota bacterium]
MILFDRVSYRYKENQETSFALEEVSFSLAQNRVIGFIGSNGCGKTTCARLIAGLLKPVSGKVTVCDIDTAGEDAEIHRKVGIIFQNPENQIVGTTVEEDIAFGLENLALPQDEMQRRIKSVCQELKFEKFLELPVSHLSGGQKQQLCIASILVMQPDWLIFDEPTSHLDPWARREFYKIIKHLLESRKVGIIIISQVPDDFALFEEIHLFSKGRLLFTGKPDDLKNREDLQQMFRLPEKWNLDRLQKEKNDQLS